MLLLNSVQTLPDEEEGSRESGNKLQQPRIAWQSPTHSLSPPSQRSIAIRVEKSQEPEDTTHLAIPKVAASSSIETLTGNANECHNRTTLRFIIFDLDATLVSAPSSPGNLSSKTLVEGCSSDNNINQHAAPTTSTSQSVTEQEAGASTKQIERMKSEETDGKIKTKDIYNYD